MSWIEGLTDLCWLSTTCKADWSAWSAIGTLAAVFVAIGATVVAVTREERIKRRERSEAKQKNVATARLISLGIDQELYTVGGMLSALVMGMDDEELNPLQKIQYFEQMMPSSGLDLTNRFLDRLDVFASSDAEAIMVAYSKFAHLAHRPISDGIEYAPPGIHAISLESIRNALRDTIEAIQNARTATRRYHPDLPENFVIQ